MDSTKIVYSVISMLAADGSISIQEMTFLKKVCAGLDVPIKEIHPMIEEVRQGRSKIHFPDNPAEKKQLFDLLAQAVVADGRVAAKEQKLLDDVAAKMGFSKSDVKKALKRQM